MIRICLGVVLMLAVAAIVPAAVHAFPDVGATTPYADAIQELADAGVVTGFPDGTFRPDQPVARAQVAKMLVLRLGIPVDEGLTSSFEDLGADDPNDLYPHEYVVALERSGLVQGLSEHAFGPYQPVSRAQLITMVTRATAAVSGAPLPLPSSSFTPSWAVTFDPVHGPNAAAAECAGLLRGLGVDTQHPRGDLAALDPWGPMPRGEVAQVLSKLPQDGLKDREGGTTTTTTVPTAAAHGPLLFSEEFDQGRLDMSTWHSQMRWGHHTQGELQYYSPDSLGVEGGLLHLRAERRDYADMRYTSGVVASYDNYSFRYGYVEMRARLPRGQGLWPALWMYPQDPALDGAGWEIDAMEVLCGDPTVHHMTLHYRTLSGAKLIAQKEYEGPDLSAGFHTYAIDWQPDHLTWYLDGVARFTVSDRAKIPGCAMYLIVNLAIGGPTSWGGTIEATTRLPAEYVVDYVRVYRYR